MTTDTPQAGKIAGADPTEASDNPLTAECQDCPAHEEFERSELGDADALTWAYRHAREEAHQVVADQSSIHRNIVVNGCVAEEVDE